MSPTELPRSPGWHKRMDISIFDRPSVAWAQPSGLFYIHHWHSLIHSFSHPFFLQTFKISLHPNHKSLGAGLLRECSPLKHISHVMCQVSGVIYQVSYVRFHVSDVMCPFFFIIIKVSMFLWMVFYERGLPRLFLLDN